MSSSAGLLDHICYKKVTCQAALNSTPYLRLGDARRRELLDLLKVRARTTGELCDHFHTQLDRCTVMQHLDVLERANLIIVKREGRFRWNYIDLLPIRELHDRWIAPYVAENLDLLKNLKRDLERGV